MHEKFVVTAAYPFIPAEINMAHIASTYLPADIYYRFLKQLDLDVVFVSATDVHGIMIKKLFEDSKDGTEEIILRYHKEYEKQFDKMGIYFDEYNRTDTDEVKKLVYSSLDNLYSKNLIYKKCSKNYLCMKCGEVLPKHYRIEAKGRTETNKMILKGEERYRCYFCGSPDIVERVCEHWFLKFDEETKSIINRVIELQSNKFVREYLESILKKGLKDWDFTRDNHYGIEMPAFYQDVELKQYIYLWFESLISYLSLFHYHPEEHVFIKHFMSKNIVYYHGIIWPVLLYLGMKGTDNFEVQISTKGFLNIKSSDKEMVDIDTTTKKYSKDYIRFYIIYLVKDNITDFYFKNNKFTEIINSILCKQLGGFFKRCRNIIYKYNCLQVPQGDFEDCKFKELIQVNALLMDDIGYIKYCGKVIETKKIYINPTKKLLEELCYLMAGALLLMKGVIPDIIEEYNIFKEFDLTSYSSIAGLKGRKIIKKEEEWKQL